MHELSIADAILQIALNHADERRIESIEVKIGHLRQVVPSSLAFAFELLTEGTGMDGAELEIESVPAVGRCRACGAVSALDGFPLQCASCDGLHLELLAGEELFVVCIELEDDGDETLTTTGGLVHGDD